MCLLLGRDEALSGAAVFVPRMVALLAVGALCCRLFTGFVFVDTLLRFVLACAYPTSAGESAAGAVVAETLAPETS